MDVELFIYGVPNGEDFWGIEEDRSFFGLFYNSTLTDKTRLLVQTRSLNGKAFCYYNFLIYENVISYDQRDNSYFGFSLRFDSYCMDVVKIYRIMDYIYNVYVLGKILKKDGSKIRYIIPRFSNVSGILGNIKNVTMNSIREAFLNEDFVSLDGFATESSRTTVKKYNLYDFTSDELLSIVCQYGEASVSPYYTSSSAAAEIQRLEQQIQDMNRQFKQEILGIQEDSERKLSDAKDSYNKEMEEKIEDAVSSEKAEIEKLNDKINRLNEENSKLRSENKKIKNERKSRNSKNENDQRQGSSDTLGSQFGSKIISFIDKLISPLILLLIFGTILFQLFRQPDSYDFTNLETSIYELAESVNALGSQDNDLGDVRIDIDGFTGEEGESLRKGTEYVVRATYIFGYDAEWEITGGEKKEDSASPQTILVTPKEDDIKIVYTYGNSTTERVFKVK